MKYVLGIDFGGGSSKALLLSESGEIAAEASVEYPTYFASKDPPTGMMRHVKTYVFCLKKAGFQAQI